MPVISITTQNLDYATHPNRETKLQGGISYVAAKISVSGCEAEYVIDSADAQVKARGNYTLEYPKKSIRIKFDKKQGMLGLHDGGAYKTGTASSYCYGNNIFPCKFHYSRDFFC